MLARTLRRIKNILLFRNPVILYRLPGFTHTITACPVCGSKGDFVYRNLYTGLERCTECTHVYALQQPGTRVLALLYKDDGFWELDRSHQGIHEIDVDEQWSGYLGARMGIMQRGHFLDGDTSKKIFEIGCSEGILMRELEKLGHSVEGCEMNPSIVKMGREQLGVTIHNCTFESLDLGEQRFDRVITFHTLEHLNDPHASLKKIVDMLTPDGQLLVEVPTGEEDFDNIYHVHFFEIKSLEKLLGQYFEDVEIQHNAFTNPDGTPVNSLYGFGRTPKR